MNILSRHTCMIFWQTLDSVMKSQDQLVIFIFFLINKRSKWKADRAAVTSLCVSPDGKMLLSAGQVIKMWDLDTKEVYRVSLCTTCSLFSFIYHYHKLRSVHL